MAKIIIENFQLFLSIGVTEAERATKQHIYLNFTLEDADTTAETSDDINDAFCNYDPLLQQIRLLENTEYKLIERLAADVMGCVKQHLPKTAKAKVIVHKYPAIENLIGGVKYEISSP